MISKAWKFWQEENAVTYSVQFDEVPWKFKKVLFEAMKDWNMFLVGWHNKTGNQMFVFKKEFKSEADWEKWANSFPIQINESRFWGNKEKIIIHGKKRDNEKTKK